MLIYNTSTTSKRSLWPPETKDLWVVDAEESRLQLSNEEWYDDWSSGLGANTLGYDACVTERFFDSPADRFKPAVSLPWQIERDFAEEFCQSMGTEAVRFFKSGSDAVSCAVRLARGFTKRPQIGVFDKSYHGTGDWFGPNLWTQGGIINSGELVVWPFGFGVGQDSRLKQIAAIVVEPVPKAVLMPPEGWLQHLREVCDAHGILFISDEVILGYRHHLRGYLHTAGVSADLYCYGKAMAQGAALSATTGRKDVLGLLEKEVHFSGTNNGEPLPLQIAQWTLKEYQEKDVCSLLNNAGFDLKWKLQEARFKVNGLLSRFEVVFDNEEAKKSAVKYCFDHGILWPGFCSMAISHTIEQMEKLVKTLVEWRNK